MSAGRGLDFVEGPDFSKYCFVRSEIRSIGMVTGEAVVMSAFVFDASGTIVLGRPPSMRPEITQIVR